MVVLIQRKYRKNDMRKTTTGTVAFLEDRKRPRNCVKKNGDGDRTANMSCQEKQKRQGQWSLGPCTTSLYKYVLYKSKRTRTGRVKNKGRKAT